MFFFVLLTKRFDSHIVRKPLYDEHLHHPHHKNQKEAKHIIITINMELPKKIQLQKLTSLKLGLYSEQLKRLPQKGNILQAQYTDEEVVVYQAYKESIASYAVEKQSFVGAEEVGFSFNRTSWIKPNFTWMMYRCAWGTKDERQTRILAIRLKRSFFDKILAEAVHAQYNKETGEIYETREEWQKALRRAKIVMQWDPDHEPFTNHKYSRRAIQLGIRPELLKYFACAPTKDKEIYTDNSEQSEGREEEYYGLISIEDITDFVEATKEKCTSQDSITSVVTIDNLLTPVETVYPMPKNFVVYDSLSQA